MNFENFAFFGLKFLKRIDYEQFIGANKLCPEQNILWSIDDPGKENAETNK